LHKEVRVVPLQHGMHYEFVVESLNWPSHGLLALQKEKMSLAEIADEHQQELFLVG
jgi:hypothetical protein